VALLVPTPAAASFDTDGRFKVVGPTIYSPDGTEFIAKGVNIQGYNCWRGREITQDADLIASTWKFNLIRVNCLPVAPWRSWDSNNDLDKIVRVFTSRKVVVMFEAHESTGTYFEGAELRRVAAWFRGLAVKHRDNPYVWFNVGNEPGNMAKPTDPTRLADWDLWTPDGPKWLRMHRTVIRAIRDGARADNVIVCDGTNYGQDQAWDDFDNLVPRHSAILTYGKQVMRFNGRTYPNVIFDLHLYGEWTSRGAVPDRLEKYVAAVRDAGLPLIIGEYGATHRDGQMPVVRAMFDVARRYRVGRVAWHWSSGEPFPLTTSGDSWGVGGGYLVHPRAKPRNLTTFGRMVWSDNRAADD
jgi:hypothetical protein